MSTKPNLLYRSNERGGLTIVMALVLVAVLGAATFSLSRNVVRELSMSGTVVQGEKAAAAADAGLDWVIVWAQGHVDNASFTAANPNAGQKALVDKLDLATSGAVATDTLITLAGTSDPTMTMTNNLQANTKQTFDVELRYLGEDWGTNIGGTGGSSDNTDASGGKKAGGSGSTPKGWRILVTGHATPTAAIAAQTFQAQREVVATFP